MPSVEDSAGPGEPQRSEIQTNCSSDNFSFKFLKVELGAIDLGPAAPDRECRSASVAVQVWRTMAWKEGREEGRKERRKERMKTEEL